MAPRRPLSVARVHRWARAAARSVTVTVCLGCTSGPASTVGVNDGSGDAPKPLDVACTKLRQLTLRAQGCHDRPAHQLPSLSAMTAFTELECISIMRAVTQSGRSAPEVSSVHDPRTVRAPQPHTEAEVRAWESFQLSSRFTIVPDLAPRAGRPQLEVFVDGAKIREAGGSALEARRQTPGVHELRLRHAGNERTYCLTLRECDLVILRAHGATLAAHESVTQGSCRPTP